MLSHFIKLLRTKRSTPADSEPRATPAPEVEASLGNRIAEQGLFVVGAARTGTTILQNALNDSPEIFLLGEPCFHDDPGHADFGARYNAMHRAWGNQENKSSYCPAFFETDASWRAYLHYLAGLYRYVGSKIVINPGDANSTCGRLFDFHCRHFYRSHYVFTFRNPLDTLMSTRGLAELNGDQAVTHTEVLRSYGLVIQLYIRMLRNLPYVFAIFHDAVDSSSFDSLGAALGVPLDGAMRYYNRAKVRHYQITDIPETSRPSMREALELYESFRDQTIAGYELPQIEQNAGHLDPTHYTALGALSRRVQLMLDHLYGKS